jgi:CRISPR system Cascade subunit CasD
MGIDRDNWDDLKPFANMRFGVRIDQPGIIKRDYHTALDVIRASGTGKEKTAVTNRYYLSDASFLAGLESKQNSFLLKAYNALKNPVWPLYLGRKSFVPSVPVYLPDGMQECNLEDALIDYNYEVEEFRRYDLIKRGTIIPVELTDEEGKEKDEANLLLMLENISPEGSLYMDQPVSSFSKRKFGSRYVISQVIKKRVAYTNNGVG